MHISANRLGYLRFMGVVIVAGLIFFLSCAAAFSDTILDYARKGDLEKVRILLAQSPALVSSRDRSGKTALIWAAMNGHTGIVDLLLGYDADVNARDYDGATALHWAARNNHVQAARSLLGHSAAVGVRDNRGQTPLHWAVEAGRKEMVRLLIDQGADPTAADTRGRTAYFYAHGNREMVTLLSSSPPPKAPPAPGSAETPAGNPATSTPGTTPAQGSVIIFYRAGAADEGSKSIPLFCDGNVLPALGPTSYLAVVVSPGTHNCAMESSDAPPTTIETRVNMMFFWRIAFSESDQKEVLIPAAPDEFKSVVSQLTRLGPVSFVAGIPIGEPPAKAPNSTPAAPAPEPSKFIESATSGPAIVVLFQKTGDTYTPFALGEVIGKIEYNSHGIVGSVDALERMQFNEPKDKWLSVTQRSVKDGKAEVTTEDGKSYVISDLGFGSQALAAEIAPLTSSAPAPAAGESGAGAATTGVSAAAAAPVTLPLADEPQAYSIATATGTAIVWEAYLKRYPTGAHNKDARQALDAILYNEALLAQNDAVALEAIFHRCKTPDGADNVFKLLDEASYQKALRLGNSEAFRAYLVHFPKGAHAHDANVALDDLAWVPCARKEIAACQAYVKQFSEGTHFAEASAIIKQADFEQAKAADTIDAWQKFIDTHNDSEGQTSVAEAQARLEELLYNQAVAAGTVEEWEKFDDKYRYNSYGRSASEDQQVKNAESETERLLYAEIVATPTLKACEDYENRFPDGVHIEQVKMAKEPLQFEAAKKTNATADYERFLDAYPQGAYSDQARTLLDPLLYSDAVKDDWVQDYTDYLKYCPACSNAEKAKERIEFLKSNLAVPQIIFPAELNPDYNYHWSWSVVFKETGGKIGYRVSGSGYVVTTNGDQYGPNGSSMDRGTYKVKPNGSAKDDDWVESGDGVFCGGYWDITWSGEDAGGHPIELHSKIHLNCPDRKPPQSQ